MSDAFHLELSANEHLGREVSYSMDESTGILHIMTLMKCNSVDLVLSQDLKVEFQVSNTQESKVPKVRCLPQDDSAFSECALLKKCPELEVKGQEYEICMPWLDGRAYPLATWFVTLRNMLRKPDILPWSNPPELRSQFPHKRLFTGKFPYPDPVPSVFREAPSLPYNRLGLIVGAGRTKGARPYMEDFDFCYKTMRLSDVYSAVSMLGVFDGHGGAECGQFMQDELPDIITSLIKKATHRNECTISLGEVLYRAFMRADEEYLSGASNSAGTTATVLLFEPGGMDRCGNWRGPGSVCVASAGDTRAVLCRGKVAIPLTIDHKAASAESIARVALAGGYVDRGRVMGSLAVGRALGDAHLKRGKNLRKQKWSTLEEALTPCPDVLSFIPRRSGTGDKEDEFIVLASDGLWDVMSNQEAVDRVASALEALSEPPTERDVCRICESMSIEAVTKLGSKDNVSVEIALFVGSNGYSAAMDAIPDCDDRCSSYRGTSTAQDAKIEAVESRFASAPAKRASSAPWAAELKSAATPREERKEGAKAYVLDDDDLMDFLNDDSNF